MDNAVYVGLSRQIQLRRELDIVANNIANADTTGFKVEALMSKADPMAPAKTADGPKPVKFVADAGIARDFGQGALRRTDNPLDLGVEGDAFFKVGGDDGERYTRDGHFRTNDLGVLVTQGGDRVLDEGGGEIIIDPKKGGVTISPDGTISQGVERVGKVGVVRFEDRASLEKVGDNQYRNVSNLQPQAAPDARIRQGMLESSNVRPIVEITRMMEVTRAYESMARMMESKTELARSTVQRMGRVQ
jgi:flagellar basal-body rod protein FlgF